MAPSSSYHLRMGRPSNSARRSSSSNPDLGARHTQFADDACSSQQRARRYVVVAYSQHTFVLLGDRRWSHSVGMFVDTQ
jgi:hypothetical protein